MNGRDEMSNGFANLGEGVIGNDEAGNMWAGTPWWLVRQAEPKRPTDKSISMIVGGEFTVQLDPWKYEHGAQILVRYGDLLRGYVRSDESKVFLRDDFLELIGRTLNASTSGPMLRQGPKVVSPVGVYLPNAPDVLRAVIMPVRVA